MASWSVKYRPKTMDDYVSEHINTVVLNKYKSMETRPNIVLVHGSHGCGKTTLCRILAKYYQCENPQEDGTPCEECANCRSINESLFSKDTSFGLDTVIETDGARLSGIDEVRDILADLEIAPMDARYKVWIIDEAHKMSNKVQNHLLKILEEPYPHLVVFFATTDKDKLLPTIISRCTDKIQVQKQTIETMTYRLGQIAEKEGLTVSKEALQLISKRGDRTPRDCINLLERVASTFGGKVTLENVKQVVRESDIDVYSDFFEASNKSLSEILVFLYRIEQSGEVNLLDFMDGLTRFVLDCLKVRHGIALDEYAPDMLKIAKGIFDKYTASEFDLLIQAVENAISTVSAGTSDNKIKMVLLNLALRIGKLDKLAQGYGNESSRVSHENAVALQKYRENMQAQLEKGSEQVSLESEISLTHLVHKGDVNSKVIEIQGDLGNAAGVRGNQSIGEMMNQPMSEIDWCDLGSAVPQPALTPSMAHEIETLGTILHQGTEQNQIFDGLTEMGESRSSTNDCVEVGITSGMTEKISGQNAEEDVEGLFGADGVLDLEKLSKMVE